MAIFVSTIMLDFILIWQIWNASGPSLERVWVVLAVELNGFDRKQNAKAQSVMRKHKLPVALIDGKLIADSSLIIGHLQERYPQALNDNHLAPLQRAHSVAIRALFETHMYFVGL